MRIHYLWVAIVGAWYANIATLGFAADALPAIDPLSPIYEVKVEPNVSYDDVVTSLKVAAEGKNFVNPANFPIAEHIRKRDPNFVGVLEVHAYCNLGLGAVIMQDHPEFAVFAPCRIALYQKKNQLYLALDRPTFDLKYINHPTERAQKAAAEVEKTLIEMMDKARKGEI